MMTRNTMMIAVSLFGLITATFLLSACHTTAGAGEDISHTGKAIEDSAEKHTP